MQKGDFASAIMDASWANYANCLQGRKAWWTCNTRQPSNIAEMLQMLDPDMKDLSRLTFKCM